MTITTTPIFLSNLHAHTQFCDGKHTPAEMIEAALQLGFKSIGLSGHSYLPFGEYYCMSKQGTQDYIQEVARLKQVYAGRIEVYIGIEADYYTGLTRAQALQMGLDYMIGSVHYIADSAQLHHYCIDHTKEDFAQGADSLSQGNIPDFVARYYRVLQHMLLEQQPHILGHADLVVKLNQRHHLFDEQSNWYRRLEEETCQAIQQAGTLVEVNTGGIARGYRNCVYPSLRMLQIMHSMGIPLTLSSDAHHCDGLAFGFDNAAHTLRSIGYKSIKMLLGGQFIDQAL